jgi:hypothetical protein
MTHTDLIKTVDGLGAEDRIFLTAYLQHLARVDDPVHRAQLGQRNRRIESGRKITLEQAQRLHDALESEGL